MEKLRGKNVMSEEKIEQFNEIIIKLKGMLENKKNYEDKLVDS